MKQIGLSLWTCLALALNLRAGSDKELVVPASFFKEAEWQLECFGSYTVADGFHSGGGGGVGVNYFFVRYLGAGLGAHLFGGGVGAVADIDGRLIARYPVETYSLKLAPYLFAGAGLQMHETNRAAWSTGGGLEWRVQPGLGVYGEARCTWTSLERGHTQMRIGVRVAV